jgi:hypothetical protein
VAAGAQVWRQLAAQGPPPPEALAPPDNWIGGQVFAMPGAYAVSEVLDRFEAKVWKRIRRDLEDWIAGQGVERINALVWAHGRRLVGNWLRRPVRTTALRLWGEAYGGFHEAAWLAVYAFFERCAGYASALEGHMMVSRAAGWWWSLPEVAVLTERPRRLARDPEGRPHCATGPALAYPDGWELYAWHGVLVPRRVALAPETLTAQEIASEPDVEVRRVMLERFGAERYLLETNAEVLDEDERGILYRAELPGDEPLVMVRVRDATPDRAGERKEYWLRVPPTTRTAREAVAWTFDKRPQDYAPVVET